jgi:predicted Zn-dependent peptidase
VESIRDITADLLYTCYNAFYNLHNMVLAIAGNFDIDAVVRACDKILQPAPAVTVETRPIDEPADVRETRVEQHLAVSAPIFEIGFKGISTTYRENVLSQVVGEIVGDLIIGESTALYRELYDEGLINATFDSEVLVGPNYLANLFSGESRDPDAVFARLKDGILRLQQDGIAPDDFERARCAAYGRYVGLYGSIEPMAGILVMAGLAGFDAYEMLDRIASLTLNDAQAYLRENFDTQRAALSVVRGGEPD